MRRVFAGPVSKGSCPESACRSGKTRRSVRPACSTLQTDSSPLPRRSQEGLLDETSAKPQTGCELPVALVHKEGESRPRFPARAKPQSEPVGRLPTPLQHPGPQTSARYIEVDRSLGKVRYGHHNSNPSSPDCLFSVWPLHGVRRRIQNSVCDFPFGQIEKVDL